MDIIKKSCEMEWFADRVRESRFTLSEHVIRYLMAGKVTVRDIETALLDGRVLEEHRHSTRGASYLVLGVSKVKRPLHVMCADGGNGGLMVLFAYVPAPPIWTTPTRRNDSGGHNMADPFSTCFFCGGEMKTITVGNFDYRLEGKLYVIKKVPAGLCLQCGEKYIEAEVGRKMNALIEEQRFTRTEQVDVIDYQ
jgi:YgiT-type zinc finger domain-containing protein